MRAWVFTCALALVPIGALGGPAQAQSPSSDICATWLTRSTLNHAEAVAYTDLCPPRPATPAFCPSIRDRVLTRGEDVATYVAFCRPHAATRPASGAPLVPGVDAGAAISPPLAVLSPQSSSAAAFMNAAAADALADVDRLASAQSRGFTDDATLQRLRRFILTSDAVFTTTIDNAQAVSARLVKSQTAAKESENNRTVCLYRTNVMAFLTGIATLARAPKIMDDTKLLALAAPIGFSRCEKSPSTALSPITPITPLALKPNASAEFTVLEQGYADAFSATPADPSLLTIAPSVDKDGKVKQNAFTVTAVKGAPAGTTFVTVGDANGQTQNVFVRLLP